MIQHIIYGEGKDGIALYIPVVSRKAGEEILPTLTGIRNARVVSIEYATTLCPPQMTQLTEKGDSKLSPTAKTR